MGHGRTIIRKGVHVEPNFDYYGLGTQFGPNPALALRMVCNMLPDNPLICEIGSWVGTSSCIMAGEVGKREGQIYCVDKFDAQGETNPYLWNAMKVAADGDTVLDRFLFNRNALGYQNIIHPLAMTSEKAARVMADHIFDFVFIDGDHQYSYASRDIDMWLPKVKPGGIIGGHDFECRLGAIPRSFLEQDNHDHVNKRTGEVDCVEADYVRGIRFSFHPGVIQAVEERFMDKVNHLNTVWWVRVDG